ncbi:DUF6530 family protein [Sorangium cellulosum]|uniref:DUF6530 family protein n=1 Tax=Sorangium TaxID=39643 RepID=UPI003B8A5F99
MKQLPLPTDLQHQPLRAVPYVAHDGKRAGNTDAQHLSVGRAQWEVEDLSVKVFRHVDSGWSRQSEELPVSRAIDLVIFAALALFCDSDELPDGTFENQPHPLKMQPSPPQPCESIEEEYAEDVGRARGRLRKLREVLNELHRDGRI